MSSARSGTPGATRDCPHCRATILESAAVCPACRHHLRFDPSQTATTAPAAVTPLKIEGTIRQPDEAGAWEYCVVVSVRNDRGEEVSRKVVGVGAMQAGEQRSFSMSVELLPVDSRTGGKPGTRH